MLMRIDHLGTGNWKFLDLPRLSNSTTLIRPCFPSDLSMPLFFRYLHNDVAETVELLVIKAKARHPELRDGTHTCRHDAVMQQLTNSRSNCVTKLSPLLLTAAAIEEGDRAKSQILL